MECISLLTSMALLLLSGTVNAEGKITPSALKKVDDESYFIQNNSHSRF